MASTTLTSWALLLWKALHNAGQDPRRLFEELDLNPQLLGDGNARYPVEKMQQLWRNSVAATGDLCFGVEVGKLWSPTTFHALGFAWLASSSLVDALRRFVRYSALLNDSLIGQVDKDGAFYKFYLSSSEALLQPYSPAVDAAIVSFTKMCRLLMGEDFAPREINVYLPPTSSVVPLEAYVRCNIKYQTPTNDKILCIIIDADVAEKHLPTGNSALVAANEALALDYLKQLKKGSVTNQVIATLATMLPSGQISEQDVADDLNMSLRTLQRKLNEEGTNFKTLLNQTRQDMSKDLMGNSHLSLSEISYLLGFSEQANFTRAFRRWHDQSPSEYRKNLLKKIA